MKILAIGAHLDDIELACGGTLAKAIASGHQVKVVVMSRSGYTDSIGKMQRTDYQACSEGIKALNSLGILDISILKFENKNIVFNKDIIVPLDNIIANYNPDIIFTHHPFDTHQDHEAVAKATISAARRKNTIYFYEPIFPAGRSYVPFKPQLYVNINDTINTKLNALRYHVSEYNKFGKED